MKRMLTITLCSLGAAGDLLAEEGKDTSRAEFVGAESCKKCHLKQYKSWKETDMAKAFDTLKPGEKKEAKEKWKLDPAKDYTQEEKCLKCHTTGYGEPGGYPVLGGEWTDDQKKLAEARQGVQCEACHGPGSLQIPVKKENKEYKLADLKDLGWRAADEQNCLACHNKDSPTIAPDERFDFDKKKTEKDKLHEHVELKYKH